MPFTGGERHWQLQIPAHSADRTRHSRGADSRARRKTSGWYRLALKWHQPPNLSLRGGRRPTWQSREGSCDFADGFPVVRPCSARLPRRFAPRNDTSGERAVHQCTCAVELPSARCSGNAAAFPIGAISRFLRKKIPEAQASGSFSNTINHNQSQSITINHNQLFTSRRPSSGGRSGAGRPHSPEPSGPRAAACSNR